MDIKPIKEIERLMAAEALTPEGARLDLLATLGDGYDRKHFPMDVIGL